ncbi:glycoside hydrolase family 2 protein [Pseudohyphozyma bogoriensis]|nr:glycoside hydrolase family 2 protein [Pseudohyphozyma bogoriensis]
MSWRATPSTPAPPVTTSTTNTLFSNPSPRSTRSYRTVSSTSGSATSHLQRQMALADGNGGGNADDGASMRSGRSGVTIGNGFGGFYGRSRTGSVASGRTMASSRTVRERSSGGAEGSGSNSGDEEEMELTSPVASSKSSAKSGHSAFRPDTASANGGVPHKRQRVSSAASSRLVRKNSWMGSLGKAKAKASTEVSGQSSLEEPEHFQLDGGSSGGEAPVVPSPLAQTPISETPPIPPTTSSRPAPTPALTPTTVAEPPPDKPTSLESMNLTPKAEKGKGREREVSSGGRGWLTGWSLSRPASAADMAALAKKQDLDAGEDKMEGVVGENGGEETPKAEVGNKMEVDGEEGQGGTIKHVDKSPGDDSTLTPKATPRLQPTSSTAYQRSSWWGWGGSSAEPSGNPPTSTSSSPTAPTEPVAAPPKHDVSASTSSISTTSTSESSSPRPSITVDPPRPKGWMETIWGSSYSPATTTKLAEETSQLAIANEPVKRPEESTPVVQQEPDPPHPEPAQVAALKHSSSWSFFPSRRSSGTVSAPPTVPEASEPQSIPPGPPSAGPSRGSSTMSKSPMKGLGLAPSITSSRASTLSRDDSSQPPSPRLGPQADNAPLKPLTGSIRSAARPRSTHEPDAPFENLVLPTFQDTFLRPPRSFPPKKSKLDKAVSLVQSYLFSLPPQENEEERRTMKDDPAERLPKCLEVMGEVREGLEGVRRIVTIGVHGWFPTPMVRSITGEPTGTSVKFATMMHDSVQAYLESHDISSFNIQAIALEGEGQVDDRVNKLYSQLTGREEWITALKKADVVFLATHSQGSVVSAQLLARMIETGLVLGPRTHMLAMCGIAQGPFVYLNQSYAFQPYFNFIESQAARELFEFQDPESSVTIKLLQSLEAILSAGVKVTVVGSINDQVTPLYSSLFAGISHPGILRAVYIDSAAFRTSDFLANLIVFASRLRNAGLKDHDLIYHVSEALAGALTGVGHSKIYEEEEVFTLAVRYQFETTALAEAPTYLNPQQPTPPLAMSFNPRERRNPYLLTWALRGIIEDPQIRELYTTEMTALREAFETWRPTTKVLKDVKLKLEAWEYRQSSKPPLTPTRDVLADAEGLAEGWTRCTQMPSQIHVELIEAGRIPDPFLGLNEEKVQWVGESDWIYRTVFPTPEGLAGEQVDLVFDGLDTFATVVFNGLDVLKSDNMFLPHRVSVADKLKPACETNVLVLHFTSAFIQGRIIEKEKLGEGKHNAAWNGDPSRLWVRKAGYNYGYPQTLVNSSGTQLFIKDFATSLPSNSDHVVANFTLTSPSGAAIRKQSVASWDASQNVECAVSWEFKEGEVELWWSVGLGKQPLYTITATISDAGGRVLDSVSKRIGFRRLRVVQEPLVDEPGTSFYFEVNGVPVFCGGSNWIPIDSFLTNATTERYRNWLELLVAGNQNMIRVWGGGVYEHDDFYDLCDELGILVWQDFMFGCGQYPAHPEFVASVKAEAEANVARIRHHPALAIFAGNNEDYQIAEAEHLEYDPKDRKGDWTKTSFPAREIYERTLPEVVNRLTDVYYHPGSPWGGKDTRDPTIGDIHQWNVWHGSQEPYQHWDKLSGRFVSEFGMQGLPDIRTTEYYLDGNASKRYPQSKTVGYHNKADGFERRLELYLVENIRHSFDLESYTYATQFIQAETLSTAYRLWRRNFKGPGKAYTAGALVWQLNDVYPCTSWAIVDYFLRPKPAYYTIAQSLEPIAVGVKRYTTKTYPNPLYASVFEEHHFVEIWAANSRLQPKDVEVVVEAYALLSGEKVFEKVTDAKLLANQATELDKLDVPVVEGDEAAAVVVAVKLVDPETKEVLSRFSTYPEPYKFLTFPSRSDVALKVNVDLAAQSITISAARPVKGLILSFNEDVTLSDNCLDLIPGDVRVVKTEGLTEGTKVQWRYLGDE